MKLKDSFLTHEIDGDQVMVCLDADRFSGLVRSNESAALIIDCLKSETTIEAIADELAKHYDGVTHRQLIADISEMIEQLKSIDAIEE